MPVPRLLSVGIAVFAALVGGGLILGAQISGPGSGRFPFAAAVFVVQVLFVLARSMATRPPALLAVAGVAVAVAAAADAASVLPDIAALGPLGYVTTGGFLLAVLVQLFRSGDRKRVGESLGATLFLVLGVVALATLIVLSRRPLGAQAIVVALGATAASLVVARLGDAVLPWPRMAPQVPRGAIGVVVGAMGGTLASAVIATVLVGFGPTSGAIVGFVTASTAVLSDLSADYGEASRQMAGDPPTLWVARHMNGPLTAFALAAPAAYAATVFLA